MLATKKPPSSPVVPATPPSWQRDLAKADQLSAGNGHTPSPQATAAVATLGKRRGRPPNNPAPPTAPKPQPDPAPATPKNGIYLPPTHEKPTSPARPAGLTIQTGPAPAFKLNGTRSARADYFKLMVELGVGQWFVIPGSEKLSVRHRGYAIRAIRKKAARLKLEGIDVGTSVVTGEIVVKRA